MRILVKRESEGSQSENRNLPKPQAEYAIPNGTITWVSIIYLLIETVSGSLSNYIAGTSQRVVNQNNKELIAKNFELQLIQRCLEQEKSEDRKSSLLLLIKAGLIDSEKEKYLLNYIEKIQTVPQWRSRPLEPLNSYIDYRKETNPTSVPQEAQITKPGLNAQDNFKPGSSQSQPRSDQIPTQ